MYVLFGHGGGGGGSASHPGPSPGASGSAQISPGSSSSPGAAGCVLARTTGDFDGDGAPDVARLVAPVAPGQSCAHVLPEPVHLRVSFGSGGNVDQLPRCGLIGRASAGAPASRLRAPTSTETAEASSRWVWARVGRSTSLNSSGSPNGQSAQFASRPKARPRQAQAGPGRPRRQLRFVRREPRRMPGETGWDPGARVGPRYADRQVQWSLASPPGRARASGRRASRREGLDDAEPPWLRSAWPPPPRHWGSIQRRLLLAHAPAVWGLTCAV